MLSVVVTVALFAVDVSTYYAVASLVLLHRLHRTLSVSDLNVARGWCARRLTSISHSNKPLDCRSAFSVVAVSNVSILRHSAVSLYLSVTDAGLYYSWLSVTGRDQVSL